MHRREAHGIKFDSRMVVLYSLGVGVFEFVGRYGRLAWVLHS